MQFFDVDTEQVLSRIRSSLWPYKNTFLNNIKGRGDLYGLRVYRNKKKRATGTA